ncbi:hypothetical protein [Azospirillum rugosum]|uniref:4-amino-4-deoxy-L-arabinose transferase n=1 Tax=Azospirillum rugosum TaxID=416170 RepID=A0ABS4SS82_9PROT|nr:hypothetical protein [Azospirillum rugosum]MBP2295425.1 hypothetical protein [Azospirillum rugosum]MDQ0528304.1 hypothetical protein [Azospirillum rugosum]
MTQAPRHEGVWIGARVGTGAPSGSLSNRSLGAQSLTMALPLAIILVLLVLPLLLVDMPPMLDYPNHLARVDVLLNFRSDPFLAEHYTASLTPVPNLLMEAVMLPLASVLPLYVAGRLYVALAAVLTMVGVLMLHRTLFGRWSLWPLCGALFVYNATLIGGFMSFSLGIAFLLIGVSLWLRLEGNRWQLAVAALFALFLYFSHAIVLGSYALCLFAVEATKYVGPGRKPITIGNVGRDALRFAALLALPILLFAVTVGTQLLHSDAAAVGAQDQSPLLLLKQIYWRLKKLTELKQWGYRINDMLAPVLNYNTLLDTVTLLLVVGGVALAALTRRLRASRAMMVAVALFAVCFFVVPDPFFGTYFVSIRFWILAAFLLVAGTDIRFGGPRAAAVFAVGLLGLLTLRTGVLLSNWYGYQDDVADLRRAAERIEPGSHVLLVWAGEQAGCCNTKEFVQTQPPWRSALVALPSLIHLPSLITIERRAFVPTLFSHPGKQPLTVTQPFRDRCMAIYEGVPVDVRLLDHPELATQRDHVEPCAHYVGWKDKYDYVLLMFSNTFHQFGLKTPDGVEERYRGTVFDLWKVSK